jgi:hypothetical protein
MGGILGGGSNAKQAKAVGSLQFQTSQQGSVIPLVYGTTRMTGNLLDYDDFTAKPSSKTGGKGKGGGGGKGVVNNTHIRLRSLWGCARGQSLAWESFGGIRTSPRCRH